MNTEGVTAPFPVAIVASRFNEEITDKLVQGALDRLKERGFTGELVKLVWVPGAIEIPLVAKTLAETHEFEAIIALGAVVRGETSHYDYVCDQVSQGCSRVSLDTNTPVLFGVLTTETWEQAVERVGGRHGHKGKDAVDAAIATVSVLREIRK